jgi:hypothetical protein
MIQLDKNEKQWILLIKGQLEEKYPFKDKWVETLKPLFVETYGWNPDEDRNYQDYLRAIFNKLLDIQMKIKDNWVDPNAQLKELFFVSFHKSIFYEEELPIERAIHKLCGLIKLTSVIDNNKEKRFELF